nr:hypothetical protein [uncultured Clostridium sp.]
MKDIPDIYLFPIEMILLKEYLILRQTYPNQEINQHLFIRRNRGDYLSDKAVAKTFITKAVKTFSGFGPQTLRISCLQEMAH